MSDDDTENRRDSRIDPPADDDDRDDYSGAHGDHQADSTDHQTEPGDSDPGPGDHDTAPGDREAETEGSPEGAREGPLSDVADAIDRRQDEAPDPAEDDLFEEKDVAEVDREALWRQVEGEEAASVLDDEADEDGPVVDRGGASTPFGEGAERVIDKEKYCQTCEYFSPPPDVGCHHEGTEILEMVDMEHFRVVDCPVVREDEELENV